MKCIKYLGRDNCRFTSSGFVKGLPNSNSKVEKVKQLYHSAFALTNGRPSNALLHALKQQAKIEGVKVTGQQIHDIEYDQYISRMDSMDSSSSTLPHVRSEKPYKLELLNSYLDVLLNKDRPHDFLKMLNKTKDVRLEDINQSLVLRYVMKCRKANRYHNLSLTGELRLLEKLIGCYYQKNLVGLYELKKKISQKFANDIIANYTFYRSDFTDLKAALLIINPSLKFATSSEMITPDEIVALFPISKHVLNPQNDRTTFAHEGTSVSTETIDKQVNSEKIGFTYIKSISSEEHYCKHLWRYKSQLRKRWSDELYKALLKESQLYCLGDTRDFRLGNCFFLDEQVVSLRKVANQAVNYILEEVVTQFDGISVYNAANTLGGIVKNNYTEQKDFSVSNYMEYLASLPSNTNEIPRKASFLNNISFLK